MTVFIFSILAELCWVHADTGRGYCFLQGDWRSPHSLSEFHKHFKSSSLLQERCTSWGYPPSLWQTLLTPSEEECLSGSRARAGGVSSLRHYWNPRFLLGLLWHPPHRDAEEYAAITTRRKLLVHCSAFLSINVDLIVARKGGQFMLPSCLLMKWVQYRLVLHNRSHFSVLKI